MVLLRERLDRAHVALGYLLVVLGASARRGRVFGLTAAFLTFAAFNFFFIPPYGTFSAARGFDWLILGSYLVTAIAVAQLLHRAEREAAARERLTVIADQASAAHEALRRREAFFAALSHDLRTPITTIRALAHDLALHGDAGAHALAEEADRLAHLVHDLLELSHLREGVLPVRLEINAAEDVIGAAIQQTAGIMHGRTLRAAIDPAEPVLAGRFDFVHTLRIVVNLIENAVKYAGAAQPIDLGAYRRGTRLYFTVADRGPGLPAAARARLARLAAGESVLPPEAGTGLGLAIADGLARAQGGELRAEPREGGGELFTLALPAADLPDLENLPADR